MRAISSSSTKRPRIRRGLVLSATALTVLTTLSATSSGSAETIARSATRTAARSGVSGCGATQYKPGGAPWTCTFADNFSGTTIDPKKWLVTSTAATGFTVGRTCFVPKAVTQGGGHLTLRAADAGRSFWCRSGRVGGFVTRYTGGHVVTNGRFQQTYGRFAVRARYPRSTAGLHAGFWMYPAKMTYGAWPASGEIDVSEWWSVDPHSMVPTLHYRGSTRADSGRACTVTDPTAWHTYQVDWLPRLITFSIDGHPCFSRTWRPWLPQLTPQPFDRPFTLVLTNAVDSNTWWNKVTTKTTLPASYQVDWARAWR